MESERMGVKIHCLVKELQGFEGKMGYGASSKMGCCSQWITSECNEGAFRLQVMDKRDLEVSREISNSGFGFFILLLSLFNFPCKMTFCPSHVIPIMLQVTQIDYL